MKKILLLCAFVAISLPFSQVMGQRYITEVFPSVDRTNDQIYAANITVLTGMPAMDTLRLDVYEPTGDTMSARPVVLVAHTGSFLPPPINGQCTGTRKDWTVEMLCNNLAKRGYVAIAFSYRQGWNPVGTQEERTGTLLNAAYRGIQDTRTAVRWVRADAATSNTFRFDANNVIVAGIGTGGYLSLGTAYLDKYSEIELSKFIDPNDNLSYVDTSLSGDLEGKNNRPLNIGNHVAYSSDIQFSFNLGGAVGDSSWINANEPPVVSFQVPSDPFAPYGFGPVIVPTTQEFVVNVSGALGVISRADRLGLNASYTATAYPDGYTAAANAVNGGLDGLFPFFRPTVESGPWEYFDSTGCPSGNVAASLQTNPDMSIAKATAYLDTVSNYASHRIACALGFATCGLAAAGEKLETGAVSLFPNPSNGIVNVRSTVSGNNIQSIEVMDLAGRAVMSQVNLNGQEASIDGSTLSGGLYFVKVNTRKGVVTKKVIFE
jgi:alpha/beta superfamily hydrolase